VFERFFRRSPSEFQLQVNPTGAPITAAAKDSLLLSALQNGIAFPHNCRVGGCGECKCRLVSGKVKELTDKTYLLSAEELKQNYILACQSQPRSDVVIEVTLREQAAAHPVIETRGRITACRPLTHDILHVSIEAAGPLPHTAGQYVDIALPEAAGGTGKEVRSYSFARAPASASPTALDFYIRKVPGGAFTDWLFAQDRTGETLNLIGPHGSFALRADVGPIVCIAGGSGFAPIQAVLEQAIRDQQATRPLVIVMGARTQADVYAQEHIDQLRRSWSGRFHFEAILSAEPEGSNWQGKRGLVNEHLPALLGERFAEHSAYLCGPPAMIDACVSTLRSGGVLATRIHFDKFLDRSNAPASR
jgi:NAD(P)H-flavin reductase/ferredoxin